MQYFYLYMFICICTICLEAWKCISGGPLGPPCRGTSLNVLSIKLGKGFHMLCMLMYVVLGCVGTILDYIW